ncbi:MAG: ABC transporter permease [Acidobacteria bacterium]|nr:ABC transporter permease [Acidobacteriota bacterium]
MRLKRRALVLGIQIVILFALIAGWEIASRVELLDDFFFSRPSVFFARAYSWLADPNTVLGGRSIYHHLFVTLQEMAGGFVFGVIGGIVAGFLLGRSEFWSRVFNPYIQVLNALPRLILAPIFVLVLGIDQWSKIALGFSLVFFIVFFNAYRGVREVDRNILNNVRLLGATEAQIAWHVLLPSAMTWILSSLHTSVGFALVGAVVGEYLAASQGLGWVISQAQGNFDSAGVYAGMVILCVVVVAVEMGVSWLERRLVRWKESDELFAA